MRSIIANIFISDLQIVDAGLITVTNVKVTNDLKIAKIYISFLDNQKPIKELLGTLIDKKSIIRSFVGKELNLKYIPELRFYHDNTMEYADNINQLINMISNND